MTDYAFGHIRTKPVRRVVAPTTCVEPLEALLKGAQERFAARARLSEFRPTPTMVSQKLT